MKIVKASKEAVALICAEQDPQLETALGTALKKPNPNALPAHTYAPNEFLLAIAVAGRLLRYRPGRQLAQKKIEKIAGETHKVAVDAFIDIVNASVESAQAPANTPSFQSNAQRRTVHGCAAAEPNFLNTIQQLEDNFLSDGAMTHGAQIIMDGDRPIFLRKGGEHSAKTSLSLETVYINGIPYPPGSIMHTPITSNPENPELAMRVLIKNDRVDVLDTDQIVNPTFVRLSAFALGSQERAEDFVNLYGEPRPKNWLGGLSIGKISNIVGEVAEVVDQAGGTVTF